MIEMQYMFYSEELSWIILSRVKAIALVYSYNEGVIGAEWILFNMQTDAIRNYKCNIDNLFVSFVASLSQHQLGV